MSQQWLLDPLRNQHYYFSTEESCYIYQNGQRIYLNEAHSTTAPGSAPVYVYIEGLLRRSLIALSLSEPLPNPHHTLHAHQNTI